MKSFAVALLSAVLLSHSEVSGIALDTHDKHAHHSYKLVEKVQRGAKNSAAAQPVDFAALGGLLGGLTTVVGGIVGGEAGKDIVNSGNLVTGVATTAGKGGSEGDIIAAAAKGIGNFGPDIGFAANANQIGTALGKATDNINSGNVEGALTTVTNTATAMAPLNAGGDLIRLSANTTNNVLQAADKKDVAGIAGTLTNSTGSFIGGALGANIRNLTPTAQGMATQAKAGNVGNVVGLGLSGIGSQLNNQIASTVLQTTGQTAGIAVNQAIAGNETTALLSGLTTLTNAGQAVQQVVNPSVPGVTSKASTATTGQANAIAFDSQTGLTSFVNIDPKSTQNVPGVTKFLMLSP